MRRLLVLVCLAAGCAPAPPPSRPSAPLQLAEHLSGFIWPLPLETAASLSAEFGSRGERHHAGLDLRRPHGALIYAALGGRVRFSGSMRGYGLTVILDHGSDISSLYAHASALYVRAGDHVSRGDVIAAVGATGNATGPHLHFEVAWDGVPIDPIAVLPRLDGSAR